MNTTQGSIPTLRTKEALVNSKMRKSPFPEQLSYAGIPDKEDSPL
jgi:hypothetical protein